MEQNLLNAKTGGSRPGRSWSDDEVRSSFESDETPVIRDLFLFAAGHSADGVFNIPGRKQYPSFGFRINSIDENGDAYPDMIFRYGKDDSVVRIYPATAKAFSTPKTYNDFMSRMKTIFGNNIDWDKAEPAIPVDLMSRKFAEFKELILWLAQAVRH